MQTSTKVQPNVMQINMSALGVIEARRCATIMDIATLLNKGIHIPDLDQFMWIQTKQNYDKHVERMENWKDISEDKEWASKVGLVPLFFMKWETPMLEIMLKFFNTFVIKGINIYFVYEDKMYVISKQLIIDVFGVCVEGYVKGQVNKTIALQELQSCRIACTNYVGDQWNAKSLGLPCSIKYLTIISMIYQKEKVTYFSNKNAITLMKIEKGKKVDWVQII